MLKKLNAKAQRNEGARNLNCSNYFHFAALPICALAFFFSFTASAATLEEDFQNPPPAVQPGVFWHWMGANFSTNGITKDLEAMHASGISSALIFNLSSAVQESQAPTENLPWPDQTYRSPKYWEAVRHAAAEADRLGMTIGLHNSVGYSATGGPWIDEARSMQRLVWTSTEISGGAEVVTNLAAPKFEAEEGWGFIGRKLSYFRDIAVLAVPAAKTNLAVAEVLNLTKNFSTDGELRWAAPPGQWRVYRLAHASTGHPPQPPPDDVLGKVLEADKFSLEQTKFHWDNVINPVREHLGPLFGKSFRYFHIDSYEAGHQNWTENFRAEFQQRKGYDPLPWLVTLGGEIRYNGKNSAVRTLGSADETARFEWDYRDVIATLFYEKSWRPASELIHASGVDFQWEPYSGPFSTIEGAPLADVPMVEFWSGRVGGASPQVIASAHAAGKKIIASEAFTGRPEVSQWTETPAFLKTAGDAAFASGVNRMVLHHWVHDPFDDRYQPGMGMGWWGTHFSRKQTWFEPGKEFLRYLGRVQSLLQRGETPADFVSVGVVQGDGDAIPQRALADVRVVDGKILLPSGRRYEFISLPHNGAMQPEVLAQVKKLLADGATVVCAEPKKSPSLENFPKCDDEVRALATELWGDGSESVRQIGRGKLFTRGDVNAAVSELGIKPVAQILTPKLENVRIGTREDRNEKFFFVANLNQKSAQFTASFRVAGMQPELWDAETGAIQFAPLWRENDGRTEVNLTLGAAKSVFVVFRAKSAKTDRLASIESAGDWKLSSDAKGRAVISATTNVSGTAVFASGKRVAFELKPTAAIPVAGAWNVDLAPAVGVKKQIQLTSLKSLSESEDAAVKYFSGTATYHTTVNVDAVLLSAGKRVELDLGDVRDLITVRVNGKSIGVIWHPPFVRDVTDALKPGANTIELAVANTWHNRLVGDEQFPPDFEFGKDRGAKMGRALKAYPDWFIKNQPRPETNRLAFVNWFYHRKDTPLIPSGLLGPVQLKSRAEMVLQK